MSVPEPESLDAGPGRARLEELLETFFARVRDAVLACPHVEGDHRVEAMIGVPANAHSLQRLRTVEAARSAGIDVLGLVHEPTASAIEYANRHPAFGGHGKERRHVAVYDLGGGTFDASLVRIDPEGFSVVRSGGVGRLGGDDFDRILAEMALSKTGVRLDDLPWSTRFRVLRRCAEAKEAIQPATRKLLLELEDVDGGEVTIAVAEYYEACGPLIEQTTSTLERVLAGSSVDPSEIDALLLVGGGSQMALVRRRLREQFGTRLKLSPHPFASVAMGLAVQAERTGPVDERLGRELGVWREAETGARPWFDVILGADTRLPAAGERIVVQRSYSPAHDIGCYRFEERQSRPAGHADGGDGSERDGTPWCEIRFPFDPTIGPNDELDGRPIRRTGEFGAQRIVERYSVDPHGILSVEIEREEPPLRRSFLLYGPERIAPIPRRRTQG